MPDFTSPNVNNYQIPKGDVYFTPAGGERRHMGNAPAAELTLDVETLEHFSSRTGVRTKDFTAVTGKTGTLALTLDEITKENLRIALLGGAVSTDTEGNYSFEIGTVSEVNGRVEIIGTNDIGPKYSFDFPSVTFTPSGALGFISDEYNNIELEGEVLAVEGSFGTVTELESADTTE